VPPGNCREGQGNLRMPPGNCREGQGNLRMAQGNLREGQGNCRIAQGSLREAQGNCWVAQGSLREGQGNWRLFDKLCQGKFIEQPPFTVTSSEARTRSPPFVDEFLNGGLQPAARRAHSHFPSHTPPFEVTCYMEELFTTYSNAEVTSVLSTLFTHIVLKGTEITSAPDWSRNCSGASVKRSVTCAIYVCSLRTALLSTQV
jgi:hypothetical protein